MKIEKSCGCIIIKDDKVLLIGRHDEQGVLYWAFPKGHQEPGETDFETALRETKEEVGLDVKIIDNNPFTTDHIVHNDTVLKHVLLFIAEYLGGEITPQEDEVEVTEWVPIDQAASYFDEYYDNLWREFLERTK